MCCCYFSSRDTRPLLKMAITRKATGKTGRSPLTDVKFGSLYTAHEAFCCGGSYANFRKRDGYWRSPGRLGAIMSNVFRHRRRRCASELLSLSLFAWMCASICADCGTYIIAATARAAVQLAMILLSATTISRVGSKAMICSPTGQQPVPHQRRRLPHGSRPSSPSPASASDRLRESRTGWLRTAHPQTCRGP